MKPYKFIILSSLIISSLFGFNSCSSDDFENLIDSDEFKQETSSKEFVDLDLSMEVHSDLQTRCAPRFGWDYTFDLDECTTDYGFDQHPFGFKMIILYEDKVVANDSLVISLGVHKGTMVPDSLNNPFITYIKSTGRTSVNVGLRFLKTYDPSKIKFLCLGSSNNIEEQFLNAEIGNSLSDIVLRTKNLQLHCDYISLHKLCDTKDWSKINTRIVLKRNAAQIVVLYPDTGLDFKRIRDQYSSTYWDIFTFPSTTSIMPEYTKTFGYMDFDYSYYYYKDDKVVRAEEDIRLGNQIAINGSSPGTIKYKNKDYGYFMPLDLLATAQNSTPVNTRNLKFQYILLAGNDYHNREVYWSVLPFPASGIKANTRYIYVLNENTSLWGNHRSIGTRSEGEPSVPEVISNDSFELIELSLDEPLPFEIVE